MIQTNVPIKVAGVYELKADRFQIDLLCQLVKTGSEYCFIICDGDMKGFAAFGGQTFSKEEIQIELNSNWLFHPNYSVQVHI